MDRNGLFTIALAVLVALPLTGCTESLGPAKLPSPAVGDSLLYTSEDGARLWLNVTGQGPRLDQAMRSHTSVVLSWDLQRTPGGPIRSFEQAVEPSSGLVVHHVAECGRPVPPEDGGGCYDNRAAVVFGQSGAPGGFGAAPWWGDELPAVDGANVQVLNGTEMEQREIDVGPSREDCRSIANLSAPPEISKIPGAVAQGPIVLCPEVPFPAAFHTVAGTVFELETYEPGDASIETPDNSAWGAQGDRLPLRGAGAPLYVSDETDPSELPVKKAHVEAKDKDERYAAFMEEHPGAVVFSSRYSVDGGAEVAGGLVTTRWHGRTLTALLPSGEGVTTKVVKRVDNGQTTEYSIDEEEAGPVDHPWGPSTDTLAPELAEMGPALQRAEEITTLPPRERGPYGFWASTPPHPYLMEMEGIRLDGPFLFILHVEPGDDGNEEERSRIIHPSYALFDGPTGELVLFERPRSELPFSG